MSDSLHFGSWRAIPGLDEQLTLKMAAGDTTVGSRPNSWTGSLSTGFKSWLELHLNRRLSRFFEFAGPVQLAHKGHDQQKAPVPGHCLDWRLRTLPPEKVVTPAWICIDNSEKRRHQVIRRRRKVLYQNSKPLDVGRKI